jgi:hypothetical protein
MNVQVRGLSIHSEVLPSAGNSESGSPPPIVFNGGFRIGIAQMAVGLAGDRWTVAGVHDDTYADHRCADDDVGERSWTAN